MVAVHLWHHFSNIVDEKKMLTNLGFMHIE